MGQFCEGLMNLRSWGASRPRYRSPSLRLRSRLARASRYAAYPYSRYSRFSRIESAMSWRSHANIEEWLVRSRLNLLFAAMARVKPDETEKLLAMKRFQDASMAGMARIPGLLGA